MTGYYPSNPIQAGIDLYPGHIAAREAVGPHSGPYGSRTYSRVRCADRFCLAEMMIQAPAAHGRVVVIAAYRTSRFFSRTRW
jgi:hypothetical protein